jgi:bacteriocin-like protein
MKLTGNLKKQVEKSENKEEAKDLIKDAGMELTEEELDQITGGAGFNFYDPEQKLI